MRPLLCSCLAAAVLAGCATTPAPNSTPGTPGAAGGPAPGPAAAGAPGLPDEQRRLARALDGTPVVVETTPEGKLRVAVPPEFSFDVGRVAVKPPLAAVLDRMAPGLRPPSPFLVRVSAPADPKGAGGLLLAQDRAASMRDYLVSRGVPATHFGTLGRADTAELVLSDPRKP